MYHNNNVSYTEIFLSNTTVKIALLTRSHLALKLPNETQYQTYKASELHTFDMDKFNFLSLDDLECLLITQAQPRNGSSTETIGSLWSWHLLSVWICV